MQEIFAARPHGSLLEFAEPLSKLLVLHPKPKARPGGSRLFFGYGIAPKANCLHLRKFHGVHILVILRQRRERNVTHGHGQQRAHAPQHGRSRREPGSVLERVGHGSLGPVCPMQEAVELGERFPGRGQLSSSSAAVWASFFEDAVPMGFVNPSFSLAALAIFNQVAIRQIDRLLCLHRPVGVASEWVELLLIPRLQHPYPRAHTRRATG